MGVAVKVNTSTFSLYSFNFSLCVTPNLCSSSIIKSPKSFGLISMNNHHPVLSETNCEKMKLFQKNENIIKKDI